MKKVILAADTFYGPHVVCNQPVVVGEKVSYRGITATITEVLHTEKPYRALGKGSTYEEQSANSYTVEKCYARIDNQKINVEVLSGSGLPDDLPDDEN